MKIIIIAISSFIIILCLPYLLDENISKNLSQSLTILSSLSSIITVIIAVLLYNKYGIDKTMKNKNLAVSLNLLEEIKKNTILINGNIFIQYRPTSISIVEFEMFYSLKLLFSNNYLENINFLSKYSNDLYLPKSIKLKLDILLPKVAGHASVTTDKENYGIVSLGGSKGNNEWKYDTINDKELTLYDYLIQWDDLISSIQLWINQHSNEEVDLNTI